MAELMICESFERALESLEDTLCSCDAGLIKENVTFAIEQLNSTYSPLKNDVYYANLICKELYCNIRENREKAIYLLNCAYELLCDQGGLVEGYCYGEADNLIREAMGNIEKAKKLLCDCCDSSCSSSSSCCSSSSSCCDTSSCDSSCDTSSCSSSCDTSSCSSSCDTSSCDTSCDTSSSCFTSISCSC